MQRRSLDVSLRALGRQARSSVVLVVIGLAAQGCRQAPRGEAAPLPSLEGVEVAGCAAVFDGPVCAVHDARTLRVVLPHGASEVASEGATVTPSHDARVTAWTLTLAPNVTEIRIDATLEGIRRRAIVRVTDAPKPPGVVVEARALRERGALDPARRLLEDALATSTDEERATVLSALGRLAIAQGDVPLAIERLEASASLHRARAQQSAAADDAFAVAFLLREHRRFADARAWIVRGAEWSRDYPEGRVMATFHEGALASDVGDARRALARLDEAQARATRLGLDGAFRIIGLDYALALSEAGLRERAHVVVEELAAQRGLGPCERADVLSNVGWFALLDVDAQIAASSSLPAARVALAEAIELTTSACKDARRESNLRTNLAWSWLLGGDTKSARDERARAEAAAPATSALVTSFWIELDAQIASAEGRPKDALAAYERLARLARASGAVGDGWRAADGRASALAAMGKTRDALAATAEAERLLEEESRSVALDEGRASFFGARERSARRRVGLLLQLDGAGPALTAARLARRRALVELERRDRLASLGDDARARWESSLAKYRAAQDALAAETTGDWKLSALDLAKAQSSRRARERELHVALEALNAGLAAAPAALPTLPIAGSGERLLAFFPSLAGWVVFVADGAHVRATRLGTVDPRAEPDALGRELLDPVRDALDGATRIRVIAHGALADVDFHALPLERKALIVRAPVEYVSDLDAAASAPPNDSGRSIVIADPARDLPSARAEGRAVAAALATRTQVTLYEGSDASREIVTGALGGASWLHYAGHGAYAGAEGWASALSLANGATFDVRDVLTLSRPPRNVVLSGCETARATTGLAAGIGLAHAFLAAGSDVVVAATRKVDDGMTRDLMTALYRARTDDPSLDLAGALRVAQMEVASRMPTRSWSAFRALRR